jgi:hypothetical protein
MGKGKGKQKIANPNFWLSKIYPGKFLLHIRINLFTFQIKPFLIFIKKVLPVCTKIIQNYKNNI